jgi:hypothetical protein
VTPAAPARRACHAARRGVTRRAAHSPLCWGALELCVYQLLYNNVKLRDKAIELAKMLSIQVSEVALQRRECGRGGGGGGGGPAPRNAGPPRPSAGG